MNINNFSVAAGITVAVGILVGAVGGGLGGAVIAMIITFALVSWFGPKWVVVTILLFAWGLIWETVKVLANPKTYR